jgi:hypothetical protein
MIVSRRVVRRIPKEKRMKKLMTLMLALGFLGATVAVSFADEPKQDTEKKKKSKKKKTTAPSAFVR